MANSQMTNKELQNIHIKLKVEENKMEKLISIEDGKITKMGLVVLTTNFGWVCIN
jgi:hypothetical protein